MRRSIVYQEHNFEVKSSTIAGCGKGLFSGTTLYRGDTVGPYAGEMITDAQSEQEPYIDSHYLLWLCADHLIVGENYTRYINHSSTPNVQFVVSTRWKSARVEVLKRVPVGGELFLDYGSDFWEASELECR
ncbi:MAG: SET domain-containing protein-lysine N-methyltransferase [Thiotrichales bacterium]|jgi:hypothetical protein|nr:SET domain-containing protein-lysine N-methyltransferase [Thiotrichales bacterium]MBT3612828.1 SET domain-containing protein-lysine N-methyltransferase [Thiotrichales bacterium]MBT3751767.1 SET domain-containing protein-lysine N-methyltransferase [Thiotrichales bacterium]MBT3837018.1 SET domain-containing protein-lysine N-methyltransferase [Thiotrichales bacterium]MBT4151738.1 SET domain-containing protein-lysine N-methyltransferase [Thiotrichales bacterium]